VVSFSTARLMTWKCTSILRTFSVSRIHREVIQQKGHAGSNQKSTRCRPEAVWAVSSPAVVIVEVMKSPVLACSNGCRNSQLHRSAIQIQQSARPDIPGIARGAKIASQDCPVPGRGSSQRWTRPQCGRISASAGGSSCGQRPHVGVTNELVIKLRECARPRVRDGALR